MSSKISQNADMDVNNKDEEVVAVKAVRIAINEKTTASKKGKSAEDDPAEYLSEDQMEDTLSPSMYVCIFSFNICDINLMICSDPIVNSNAEKSPENIVYLEDYDKPSTGECQILAIYLAEEKRLREESHTKVQLMDPILRKTYGSLPPLPYVLKQIISV